MFTKKNLLIITGKNLGIVFGVMFIAITAISFLKEELTRVSDKLLENRGLANILTNRTELFSVLKRDAEIVGGNDVVLERAFLPSDNILEFVSVLETLALRNSVTQIFRFESPTRSSLSGPLSLAKIPYHNTVSTNIVTFTNFLKDFERLPYFTKIESISFSAQDKNGWTGASSAVVRATLYAKAIE